MVSPQPRGAAGAAGDASAMVGAADEEHAGPRDRNAAEAAVSTDGAVWARLHGALPDARPVRAASRRRGDAPRRVPRLQLVPLRAIRRVLRPDDAGRGH